MTTELDEATKAEIDAALTPVVVAELGPDDPALCSIAREGRNCPALAAWRVSWVCSECHAQAGKPGVLACARCLPCLIAGRVTHRNCPVQPAGVCVYVSHTRIKRWWRR